MKKEYKKSTWWYITVQAWYLKQEQVLGSSTAKYFLSLKSPLFSSLSIVTFCVNPNPALICGNKTIAALLIVYNSTDGSPLPQTSMMMEIKMTWSGNEFNSISTSFCKQEICGLFPLPSRARIKSGPLARISLSSPLRETRFQQHPQLRVNKSVTSELCGIMKNRRKNCKAAASSLLSLCSPSFTL